MKKSVLVAVLVAIMSVMLAVPAYARGCCSYGYIQPSYSATERADVYNIEIDVEALMIAKKASLDSLVDLGIITDAYADLVLKNYHSMLEAKASNNGYGLCGAYGYDYSGGVDSCYGFWAY